MKAQFQEFKGQLIEEHLQGNIFYWTLGEKYGYNAMNICLWVKPYGGVTAASKDYLYRKNLNT